jgi:hypothetical protein
MRMRTLFAVIAGGLLMGCVETPKQPVMRPIPPPPSTPPPGVVYVPPTVVVTNAPAPTVSATAPAGTNNFEVSSNFVANGQAPAVTGSAPAQVVQTAPPQYEVVPPRPGPDYVWHDGAWTWNNGWSWVPGQWVYRPAPPVIIVEPGFYYGRRHYYYRRW